MRLGKFGNMTVQDDLERAFNGKTVFVTGHTGFIGSWFCLWLRSLGAKIIGYSLKPATKPSLFEILKLEKEITHIIGNVQDLSFLHECMSKHRPDMVFHLAAQPLVRLSYSKPIETFQTNIMGTVNLLESVRKVSSVKTCVIMTSDKCYENRGISYGYKESDPMGGHDPYSASKGATELVTSSYKRSFFDKNITSHSVAISTIRAGNVIGGGDWADERIVPDCIRSLTSGKSIPIRNPNSVRPWQYVLEPILGIILLVLQMSKNPTKFSQAWNFGPLISDKLTTVTDLVNQIISEWGSGEWIDVSEDSNDLHEAELLVLDPTKAVESLGWLPTYSIKEAIHETMSWYKINLEGKTNMKEFSLNQIQNYLSKSNLVKNTVR